MNRRLHQSGFTLLELSVVVLVIGLVSVLLSGQFSAFQSVANANYLVSQEAKNRSLSRALLRVGENYLLGGLPAPVNDNGQNLASALIDPTAADDVSEALRAIALEEGVNLNELNGDGYATDRVRVYQRVNDLQLTQPIFGQAGDQVVLTYDVGAIYQTQCHRSDNACNPDGGLPGDSPQMTAANWQGWTTVGTDSAPARISTLGLQKDLLRLTAYRLNEVRDSLRRTYNALQQAAPAGSTTNWYPFPNGAGAPILAGSDPTANQGCHDGWYDLTDASVNVLAQIGLSQGDFGVTAWGGRLEYCRDFEPTASGTATADTPPHLAAIRLHRDVSNALAPTAVAGTNVVVPL